MYSEKRRGPSAFAGENEKVRPAKHSRKLGKKPGKYFVVNAKRKGVFRSEWSTVSVAAVRTSKVRLEESALDLMTWRSLVTQIVGVLMACRTGILLRVAEGRGVRNMETVSRDKSLEKLNREGKERNGWGHVLDETSMQIPVDQVENRDGRV